MTNMRCIIGQKQRDKILSFLRPNSRMLEWGSGGSTVYFAQQLPTGATLTSVEHDPKWFAEVRQHIGQDPRLRLLLREATGPLGANATIEEEDTRPLQPFVHAADGEQFDLILVDGNARSACLQQAKQLLAPGGLVVLHDAQRAWYDEAKLELIEHGHIGSCPDYPVPHLWWGGTAELSASKQIAGEYPLIISYFTRNTEYEQEAQKLIQSCERNHLEYQIEGIASRGSWEENCSFKAEFIYKVWKTSGRAVLWVDADAILHCAPDLLKGARADFAIHKLQGWEFGSGTLYFNQTEGAATLLKRWLARCRRFPDVWDQVSVDLAWEDTVASHPLETLWLPEPYCRIFDLFEGRSTSPGVVEHFQASRRLKRQVSATPPMAKTPLTQPLVTARLASRLRPWQLSPADGTPHPEYRCHRPEHDVIVDGITGSLLKPLADAFKAFQPAGKVLCLDGGIGVFWRLLRENGCDVHGIAPTATYAAQAKEFAGERIVEGDVTHLPYPEASFDSVVALGLLEFLEDQQLDEALKEIHRVAKSGVFLVLQLAPDPEPRWPVPVRNREWWEAKLLKSGFRPHSLNVRLLGNGFLQSHQTLVVCVFEKVLASELATQLASSTAAAGQAHIESAPDPEIAAFVTRLAHFFSSETLMQVDWASNADAHVTAFQSHGKATSPLQVVATDALKPQLPFADGAFDTVYNLGSLSCVTEFALPAWLKELCRVTKKNLWVALEAEAGRDRAWWETKFFEAGFRKHPRSQEILPYESLEQENCQITLIFEKIPAAAVASYPMTALKAERDLHMDMLRESGRRSDAHIARYVLARNYIRPNDVVLDAACGLGYGSAVLAQAGGPSVRVVGLDNSAYAVDYARLNFATCLPNTEFQECDVCDLSRFADNTVNLVVSFETVEHLREPDVFLREVKRVLKPGGRLICSVPNLWVDESGKDPNPWHFHVFDFASFVSLNAKFFDIQAAYAQTAGGGMKLPQAPRRLRQINLPVTSSDVEAEWWLLAVGKEAVVEAHTHRRAAGRRATLLTNDPDHPTYRSWLERCPVDWEVVNPYVPGARIPPDALILIAHDQYTEPARALIKSAVANGVPTLILADGILEYRNTFEHPQIGPGVLFQPVLGHKVATISRAQTRIIESWGNAGRCETVGLPRLDRYYGLKRRQRQVCEPLRVLISTALTPFFTDRQRHKVTASLRDLKCFFEGRPDLNGCRLEPLWRLTKGLADEIGVTSTIGDLRGLEIADLLQTVDAVITTPSTTLLEAMMLGLPTAILDYGNSPHYVSTAWRVTAPDQIADTIAELTHPPEAKLLFQETVLHEELECLTPATPRLLALIARMIESGLETKTKCSANRMGSNLIEPSNHQPRPLENRFNPERIYAVAPAPLGDASPDFGATSDGLVIREQTLAAEPSPRVENSTHRLGKTSREHGSGSKILFVSHEASRTGAPRVLLDFLRWLRRNTDQEFEILLAKGGPLESEFSELAVIRDPRTLALDLSKEFSLIYSNTCCNSYLIQSLPYGNLPIITHLHELDSAFDANGAASIGTLIMQTSHFIACSQLVADRFHHCFRVPKERISVHYSMINPETVATAAGVIQPQILRKQFDIPENGFVITGCGTVDSRKGSDLFLQMASSFLRGRRMERPVRFLWAGRQSGGEFDLMLKHDLRRLGLRKEITFVGELESPHPILGLSDLYCLTSREDPFPLTMLEAGSLGKPVICFEGAGGGAEFCVLGGGLAVPFLDVQGMAQKCQGLMERPEMLTALGRKAADLVRERFAVEVVAPNLWHELKSFLHQPPPMSEHRIRNDDLATICAGWSRSESPELPLAGSACGKTREESKAATPPVSGPGPAQVFAPTSEGGRNPLPPVAGNGVPSALTAILARATASAAEGHKVLAELLLEEALENFPDNKETMELQQELQTTGTIRKRIAQETPTLPVRVGSNQQVGQERMVQETGCDSRNTTSAVNDKRPSAQDSSRPPRRPYKDFFASLDWRPDRMVMNGVEFFLQHAVDATGGKRGQGFLFYKTPELVQQYQEYFEKLEAYSPEHVFEIGLWDGGSAVFWNECFHPQKHVAIDIQAKVDAVGLDRYRAESGTTGSLVTHWQTDQSDTGRLREIVNGELGNRLDLVIDDASHLYRQTRASFEALFPFVRPGGMYIIEDWAWGHWPGFQTSDHPWKDEIPLTRLITELVEIVGGSNALVRSVDVRQGFVAVTRGTAPLERSANLRLEALISRKAVWF